MNERSETEGCTFHPYVKEYNSERRKHMRLQKYLGDTINVSHSGGANSAIGPGRDLIFDHQMNEGHVNISRVMNNTGPVMGQNSNNMLGMGEGINTFANGF